MKILNQALEYVYYILASVWLIWGGNYFFFQLEGYHKNFITAVYGLLIFILIFYIGILHRKASNTIIFPIFSLINIALVVWLVTSIMGRADGLLIMLILSINALSTLATLTAGTTVATVTNAWRKAKIISPMLVTLIIIWTIVFTSY